MTKASRRSSSLAHAVWQRTSLSIALALLISALAVGNVWATFTYSGFTGPTILNNNHDGTWNVQWTINVTEMSNPSNQACVVITLPNNTRYSASCGAGTGTLTCTLNNIPNNVAAAWRIDGYAGNCNSGSMKEAGPSGTLAPAAVTLADFSAAQAGEAVLLTWETNSELDNRGFNLYRGVSPGAPDRQLNAALIPSQGPGSPGGYIYTWEDRADLVPGVTYFYWVEDVDMNNVATRHGPVSVDYGAPTAVRLQGAGVAAATSPNPWPVAGAALLALAGLIARRRRQTDSKPLS